MKSQQAVEPNFKNYPINNERSFDPSSQYSEYIRWISFCERKIKEGKLDVAEKLYESAKLFFNAVLQNARTSEQGNKWLEQNNQWLKEQRAIITGFKAQLFPETVKEEEPKVKMVKTDSKMFELIRKSWEKDTDHFNCLVNLFSYKDTSFVQLSFSNNGNNINEIKEMGKKFLNLLEQYGIYGSINNSEDGYMFIQFDHMDLLKLLAKDGKKFAELVFDGQLLMNLTRDEINKNQILDTIEEGFKTSPSFKNKAMFSKNSSKDHLTKPFKIQLIAYFNLIDDKEVHQIIENRLSSVLKNYDVIVIQDNKEEGAYNLYFTSSQSITDERAVKLKQDLKNGIALIDADINKAILKKAFEEIFKGSLSYSGKRIWCLPKTDSDYKNNNFIELELKSGGLQNDLTLWKTAERFGEYFTKKGFRVERVLDTLKLYPDAKREVTENICSEIYKINGDLERIFESTIKERENQYETKDTYWRDRAANNNDCYMGRCY